jgi:hypothetical protein
MGVGSQCHAPAALPPGMTRYPLYRRLGRPQSRSGRVLNSPPPGFDPRTAQPVASRYTDYVIPAHPHILSFVLEHLTSTPITQFLFYRRTARGRADDIVAA